MATKIYGAFTLIGGGNNSLDSIDGANLVDGDVAIVFTNNKSLVYALDSTSGDPESSPDIIAPDNSGGDKRWLLQSNPFDVTKSDVGLENVSNVDCTNASNLSTGTIPSNVLPPIALTNVQIAVDEAAMLALTAEEGDVVVRSDENKSYVHNGGSAGTMSDFTELQTPTDSVLSVNGETGTVTISKGDVGLGSVPNTDFTTPVGSNTTHRGNTSNPHGVDKSDVGLGDVPNTDFTNIVDANTTHRGLSNNPHSVDKSDVGLANVPNTNFTTPVGLNTAKTSYTGVATDHGTAATDQIVNVCYGTGSPPAANTTTIGSIFIKYTA